MIDSETPLALYAIIGAALFGSVLGVFIDKWLPALLTPALTIAIPMGGLTYLRPFIERHPMLSDTDRVFLLDVADPSTVLQMVIAATGSALLACVLVRLARTGQSPSPERRKPVSARTRLSAVAERTPLQARTERLATAPMPMPAARTPAPIFEVAPVLEGSIKVSSVAERGRSSTPVAAEQVNRRERGRRRAILSGFLILDDGRSSPCRIADISDSGARVRLPTVTPLPPKLWLLNASEWMAYEAALAWRSETEAGLRFLSKRNLKDPKTAQDRAMQSLCAHLTAR